MVYQLYHQFCPHYFGYMSVLIVLCFVMVLKIPGVKANQTNFGYNIGKLSQVRTNCIFSSPHLNNFELT